MATKREQKQKPLAAAKPRGRRAPTARPASAAKAGEKRAAKAPAKTAAKAPGKTVRARKPAAPRAKKSAAAAPAVPALSRLTEEERIEDAKYQPRHVPKRLFEEDRFLFPESYGVTRIRLLVKDPEWVFVHWDVDAKTLAALRSELGERSMALTRMTLRIVDAEHGGGKTILLPPGARSWYVRTDAHGPRSYRAELGLTLPSGDFRALAQSNTVVPPRVGPSPERASVKRRITRATASGKREVAVASNHAAPVAKAEAPAAPWRPTPERSDAGEAIGAPGPGREEGRPRGEGRGGASDLHRR